MMGHNHRQMVDLLAGEVGMELLKSVGQECRMRTLFMRLMKEKKIWEARSVLSLPKFFDTCYQHLIV